MRPKLKALCGIDPKTLVDLSHPEASKKIIDACILVRDNLAVVLDRARFDTRYTLDDTTSLQQDIKYLNRAIAGRTSDYEEMMECDSEKDTCYILVLARKISIKILGVKK